VTNPYYIDGGRRRVYYGFCLLFGCGKRHENTQDGKLYCCRAHKAKARRLRRLVGIAA
jgi:hypothetical protein